MKTQVFNLSVPGRLLGERHLTHSACLHPGNDNSSSLRVGLKIK